MFVQVLGKSRVLEIGETYMYMYSQRHECGIVAFTDVGLRTVDNSEVRAVVLLVLYAMLVGGAFILFSRLMQVKFDCDCAYCMIHTVQYMYMYTYIYGAL